MLVKRNISISPHMQHIISTSPDLSKPISKLISRLFKLDIRYAQSIFSLNECRSLVGAIKRGLSQVDILHQDISVMKTHRFVSYFFYCLLEKGKSATRQFVKKKSTVNIIKHTPSSTVTLNKLLKDNKQSKRIIQYKHKWWERVSDRTAQTNIERKRDAYFQEIESIKSTILNYINQGGNDDK